ncbi:MULTISPECIES: 6-phosphogluconolactonase [unclassified Paludibacterium]|uniref:6-phosphogluconolactonase n=1 Tax=unclassified Paludibacterium TaxID=2618429 RepID=UPI001C03EC57|nr:6-phosphogluconolactonase [Paludibacterium sp. B53371]BEV72547.1 6-phosphogluconolactonase [Paludibacterium sp. THUN1379]
MKWLEFESPGAQADALAAAIAADLKQTIETNGRAVLAVSGGRSPIALFERLAMADLPWQRVTITLVDERMVPADHADSNARLVREHLLTGKAAAASFLPLAPYPEDEARSIAEACQAFTWPTVAVLGMGDDGHTASLFPEAAELDAGLDLGQAQAIIGVTPPVAPHRRLSMTRKALLKSDKLYLSIQGNGKREVFERARQAEDRRWPVSYFLQQDETPLDVYWAP